MRSLFIVDDSPLIIERLLGMLEGLLSPEQIRYVDIFRRAGDNLPHLINGILDHSKVEASDTRGAGMGVVHGSHTGMFSRTGSGL